MDAGLSVLEGDVTDLTNISYMLLFGRARQGREFLLLRSLKEETFLTNHDLESYLASLL